MSNTFYIFILYFKLFIKVLNVFSHVFSSQIYVLITASSANEKKGTTAELHNKK